MKKGLAIFLSVALLFAAMVVPNVPSVDAATSASTDPAPAPSTSKPSTPATSNTGSSSSSSNTSTPASGTYYTVKSGDVFWKIAQMHGLTIAELAKLNPQIKNINLIYPGQKILVKADAAPAASAKKLYHGIGIVSNYRISKTNLNVTVASALFDEAGKIVQLEWDVLEITPDMFPGWHDRVSEEVDQAIYEEADKNYWNWKTKREKGDEYDMKRAAISGKNWWEQLDYYEQFFTGKTVAEVKAWFEKYTDSAGKPYKLAYLDNPNITEADKKAAEEIKAKLTAEEIKMLVDVSTNATMSLQDNHSRFIDALEKAYKDRKEVK